jgi:hypothetical protein
MKKSQLIKLLESMPDSEVEVLWDGELRTPVEVVYLARNGIIVLAEKNSVVYSTEARPIEAPDNETQTYWYTDNKWYKESEL